jgi:hypothetical protein
MTWGEIRCAREISQTVVSPCSYQRHTTILPGALGRPNRHLYVQAGPPKPCHPPAMWVRKSCRLGDTLAFN